MRRNPRRRDPPRGRRHDGTRRRRRPDPNAPQPQREQGHIAFAYAGNIWIVERAGGAARRLTSFAGEARNPELSAPTAASVAFSAQYAGNVDVYLLPIEGGEPKRLTFHPGADLVQGWTPDGAAIVFATGRATNAPGACRASTRWRSNGGPETAMPQPRAYQGKISPDGKRLAYRMNNSWDEERRNYRGGQNRADLDRGPERSTT